MFVSAAAYSFSTAIILVVVFQLALALGAPWWHLAMGAVDDVMAQSKASYG